MLMLLQIFPNGKILTYNLNDATWVIGDPVTSVAQLTDVTLTNLGEGDILNYNTTSSKWENIAATTTLSRFSETTTSAKSLFSFPYAPGNIDVFINGIRLTDTDFVATDGATINLTTTN